MQNNFHLNGIKRYIRTLGKNPEADWKLLFGGFVVLAVLLLAFSGFILYQIYRGEIFLAERRDARALRTIDRNKLRELIGQFKLSDNRLIDLKAEKPILIDPGL